MQNHGPDWSEVLSRLINAVLVTVVVLVLANVLHWLSGVDSAKYQNLSGLFGVLATFAGTAIGAYFGISVSGAAARTAVNTAADTSQKLGAANEQLAATQQELADRQQQVFAANRYLRTIPVDVVAGADHIAELKTILRPEA